MSRNVVSDACYRVAPGCPIAVDLHRVDQIVEVVLGDRLGRDDAVTLALSDLDTCDQLIEAVTEARDRLSQVWKADTGWARGPRAHPTGQQGSSSQHRA